MKPLAGTKVVVTRPDGSSDPLAGRLKALGASVYAVALIRRSAPSSWKALDSALRRPASFDCVVFTSAYAVTAFFGRARALGLQRPKRPAAVYAVGPKTAAALRKAGWAARAHPESFSGANIAAVMGRLRGKSVLIPRAERGRDELPRLLKERGAAVTVAAAYRTLSDPAGAGALRRLAVQNGMHWAVFASPSAVEACARALGPAGFRAFFAKTQAAAIGPTTAQALRARGVEPLQPRKADARSLAEAVAAASRPVSPARLKAVLVRALRASGALARRRFGKVSARYKGKANLVTEADLACEQKILDIVLAAFPDHDFLAEERPPRRTGSAYTWVIDPIDGTTNYAHGFPVSCTSIAVLRRGEAVVGGVFDPFRNELFLAEKGRGATLNGKKIGVSRTARVGESLLLTGFAYDRAARAKYLLGFYQAFMERSHDVRRSGSAALDLAWTACGRVDGYWEFHLSPWDVAAGRLLVEEAGGKVSDYSGRAWTRPEEFGRQTLASNGRIHGEMLRMLRKRLRGADR